MTFCDNGNGKLSIVLRADCIGGPPFPLTYSSERKSQSLWHSNCNRDRKRHQAEQYSS